MLVWKDILHFEVRKLDKSYKFIFGSSLRFTFSFSFSFSNEGSGACKSIFFSNNSDEPKVEPSSNFIEEDESSRSLLSLLVESFSFSFSFFLSIPGFVILLILILSFNFSSSISFSFLFLLPRSI